MTTFFLLCLGGAFYAVFTFVVDWMASPPPSAEDHTDNLRAAVRRAAQKANHEK